jgi:hypothetical protein
LQQLVHKVYYDIYFIFILLIYIDMYYKACPQNWWPLSISNSFLNDVIKGSTITGATNIGYINDRIANPSNINGLYIKGGIAPVTTNTDYVSFLTLPTGTYFSTSSFTITFWVFTTQTTAIATTKTARVIDFSDAATKANGIAVYLKPGVTGGAPNNNAAAGLEVRAGGVGSFPQLAADTTGAGFLTRTWTHVAITVSSSSASPAVITVAIYYNGAAATATGTITTLPALTTSYTVNFIGKGTSPVATDMNLDAYLNDVKIFNSALSPSQVSTQFNSEQSNIFF